MSSNTPKLGLLKKDPIQDGNDTFNIKTMLNDNWDKIDDKVGQISDEIDKVTIPDASLTVAGKTMLSNSINGTRENVAATEKAIKLALDKSLTSIPDASLTVAGKTMLSNATNGTRQNVAATEYAVKLAMENVKTENYDGRADTVSFYVPSQYPNIQAALYAIKKVNAGAREIILASGYVDTTSYDQINMNGFHGGSVTIRGDGNGPATIPCKYGLTVSDCTCAMSFHYLKFTGSTTFIDVQSPTPSVYFNSITKTVVGSYNFFSIGGRAKGVMRSCTVSNCTGAALSVFACAHVEVAGMSGSNNGRAFELRDGSIVAVTSSATIGASTRASVSQSLFYDSP